MRERTKNEIIGELEDTESEKSGLEWNEVMEKQMTILIEILIDIRDILQKKNL